MLTNRFAPRGFTLTELLLVIAVIVILAAIAYPVLTSVQERARATQDMNNLRQIGLATQMYLNDNDGVLFSAALTWTLQLKPKYLPAWKIFQSPFDKRAASEAGGAETPISYGLNGNPPGSSIAGLSVDKISNPSVFILFAPAQSNVTTVTFLGTANTTAPGVRVFKNTSTPGGSYAGTAPHGTHSTRTRINALFADLHSESMVWSVFANGTNSPTDPNAFQRWTPYTGY